MMSDLDGHPPPPPSFAEAKTRRQRARAAGLDPNYWYAVDQSKHLKRGKSLETHFWGRSIAVFRGQDGRLRALENRCAHRGLEQEQPKAEVALAPAPPLKSGKEIRSAAS